MTTTKKLAAVAGAAVAVGIGVGVFLAPTPPPQKIITLVWDGNGLSNMVYELWSSTNLVTWQVYTSTPLCGATIVANKPREFFKVRATDPATGRVSDWSRNRY